MDHSSSHVEKKESSSISSSEKDMPKSGKRGKNRSLTAKAKKKKQTAVLKNKHKEEQSSPINPDGRKQYDREFLLQLQNTPQSMIKPPNLPDIPDIIIRKASQTQQNKTVATTTKAANQKRTMPVAKPLQQPSMHNVSETHPESPPSHESGNTLVRVITNASETKMNEWVPRRGDNNAKTMDHIHQEEEHRAIMTQNLIKFKTEEEKLLDSGKDDREKMQTGDKSGEKSSKNNTSHMEEIFREIKQFPLQSKKKKSGKTEQSSPINPDGRKQYDREFLLQLQNAPQSMIKPANLPDIPDIIIKKTAINYSQRMPSPVFQNSMPTTQQGLFQITQQSTTNFTHTLSHTYSSPPAVFYNLAAQQQKRSLKITGMSGQGQQPTKKRECTLLPIIDPASWKDISLEIQLARSTLPLSDTLASHSTPVSGHESTEPEALMPGSGKENQDLNEVSDQSPPVSTGGEKLYDRDFLLQQQNAPESVLNSLDLPDIADIIIEKKLELTRTGVGAPTNPAASVHIPMIEDSLNILILSKGCSNAEVFDWIKGNVDEPTTKCEHFIHALVTPVCRSAIIVSSNSLMKVDKSQIQRRKNLLHKYLDQQARFELQALYALQGLVHKLHYPPGVLCELFEVLYDEDIISDDAFLQWEKSVDPQEQESKSMALKQVIKFFTRLKDAKDEKSKCLPRRDEKNPKTIDKIHQEVTQGEGKKSILIENVPEFTDTNYSILNESVKEGEEQPLSSLPRPSSSGDFAHGLIHPQHSSTSRKLPVESLERQMQNLEKEKLQLEIELIKLKHKKLKEEMEVLKLQKDLLKMKLIS